MNCGEKLSRMKIKLPRPMTLVHLSLTSLALVRGSLVLLSIRAKISALLDSAFVCLDREYQGGILDSLALFPAPTVVALLSFPSWVRESLAFPIFKIAEPLHSKSIVFQRVPLTHG